MTIDAIQAAYPKGMYRECNWILAARQVDRLIDQGETMFDLVLCADLYAKQQRALGKEGSQFILSPENFYGAKGLHHWKGPFPMPLESPRAEAEKIWPTVRAAISNPDMRKSLDIRVIQAVGAIGGFANLGMTQASRMDFVRREFLAAYARETT